MSVIKKTIVYRTGSFCLAFLVNLVFLGSLPEASALSMFFLVVMTIYYYTFEKVWRKLHEK